MLHKVKFIISIIIAPGPKIKQNYNHADFKGKIGSHMRLKHSQAGRGWARGGGPPRGAPAPPAHLTLPGRATGNLAAAPSLGGTGAGPDFCRSSPAVLALPYRPPPSRPRLPA